MGEIVKIVILGTDEDAVKIEQLLSKAGYKTTLKKEKFAEGVSDADLILEALPSLEIEPKKEALRQCARKAPPRAILATVSPGGVTEIAAATGKPERVIGLNFTFNPFEEKCLVQIVKGLKTSAETVEVCENIIKKTGATMVVVEDVPGLILGRPLASLINEAALMHSTRVATIEDIDRVAKLCLNWPLGPFEFADYIGIDKVVAILEASTSDGAQYRPCRLLRQMVVSGQLGKKTGRGFYTYS